MKQNITAFVILIIIAAGSLSSVSYTKNVSDKMISGLERCEIAVINKNNVQARDDIKKVSIQWQKNRPILAAFIPHKDLNEISDLLITVTTLVELNDSKGFITQNKRLTALVKNLANFDIPTFENLF